MATSNFSLPSEAQQASILYCQFLFNTDHNSPLGWLPWNAIPSENKFNSSYFNIRETNLGLLTKIPWTLLKKTKGFQNSLILKAFTTHNS